MQNLLFFQGFLLSLSLIMTIGAQNIFVIKQGIAKNNIFFVCLVCFLCDFVLMLAGIFGVGKIFADNKFLSIFMTLSGIIFVLYYGIMSLISAFKDKTSLGFQAQNLKFFNTQNHSPKPWHKPFKSPCLFRYCFYHRC